MKKLAIAIVAFLAVGASAQTRHYTTENGVIHATPEGRIETRVVEVTPVRVVPAVRSMNSGNVYVVPASRSVIVPTSRTVILQRDYDDTADVELLRDRDFEAYRDGEYNSELDRARYETRYYR